MEPSRQSCSTWKSDCPDQVRQVHTPLQELLPYHDHLLLKSEKKAGYNLVKIRKPLSISSHFQARACSWFEVTRAFTSPGVWNILQDVTSVPTDFFMQISLHKADRIGAKLPAHDWRVGFSNKSSSRRGSWFFINKVYTDCSIKFIRMKNLRTRN